MPPTPEPEKLPRPRQVTLAASLVIGASALLVVSVFERLTTLRSLESRAAVQQFLSEPPGSDLGIGTESALDILRTVSMVVAGLATAAAILGYHVLKQNRAARIGLSVLAVPLFVCGLVTGGFLASVVAASAAMLWLSPSRHWFAGTTPAEVVEARTEEARRQLPPPYLGPPPTTHQPSRPDLHVTHGAPPWTPYAATQPLLAQPAASRPARPGAVVAACTITWLCCAFTALLSLLLVGVLAADAEGLVAEMHRQNPALVDQGISSSTLQAASWATGIVCLVWSLVSGVLAVLAFRRIRWAAVALIASCGAVALFCLAGSLVSPPLAVPGVLAAATVALLAQPSTRRWLAQPKSQPKS